MDTRDLVLGAVEGYRWEAVEPFVESLRATGFAGELRLFASNLDADTIARLRARGVELSFPRRISVAFRGRRARPLNARLRWPAQRRLPAALERVSRAASDPTRARARLLGAMSNVDVARYFWAWLHLSRPAASYRNVMLTDVRDVLFLRDPFAFPIDGAVCCFLEDERMQVGTQPMNRNWIDAAYGPAVLDSLSSRPISCSGVTIGPAPAILAYLDIMVHELARLSRQPSGIDQGVHNYVVHTGRVPVRLLGNESGPVLTVGIMPGPDAEALVRARMDDANVVHQYDRHPGVKEMLAPFRSGGVRDGVRP